MDKVTSALTIARNLLCNASFMTVHIHLPYSSVHKVVDKHMLVQRFPYNVETLNLGTFNIYIMNIMNVYVCM